MKIDYSIAFKKANNAHNAGDDRNVERYGRVWLILLALQNFEHGHPLVNEYPVEEFEQDLDRALYGDYEDILVAMYG